MAKDSECDNELEETNQEQRPIGDALREPSLIEHSAVKNPK
jgi:hypothetical protein